MKFYVASSYELKPETKLAHELIKKAGHSIAGDWTTHLEIAHAPNAEQLSIDYALEDVTAVKVLALISSLVLLSEQMFHTFT